MPTLPLKGARILVVEDEFLIALQLAAVITDAGAEAIGPARSVDAALALCDETALSAAILDVRLGVETSDPVARRLRDGGVPFVFCTGQTPVAGLRARWPLSPVISKPAPPRVLVATLETLISGAEARIARRH